MSDLLSSSRNTTTSISWLDQFPADKRIIRGKSYFASKRAFDLFLVLVSSPLWILVMGLISLLIKFSSFSAPVIFTQMRTGKGGKRFKMYKFRTMVPNAEEMKYKYMAENELKWPDFKITNDPRITPLGKILRKTSLDELPQLFNILKGEMSLVGPRPTSFSPETYSLWHTERLEIAPGLTGLWQIIGRGSSEFDERLRLDIAYIERQSVWLDINILVRTVWAVFQHRGAV